MPANIVEITFNLNGGTSDLSKTITTDNSWWTAPFTKPTKSGYAFIGWLFPDGNTMCRPGERVWITEFSHTAYITISAQWQKKSPQVYVNVPSGKSLKGVYAYINGTWTSHPLKGVYIKTQ